jgi:hypothetical protein
VLAEMEALAGRAPDVAAYSAQLAGDGYFQRFTDAYTALMTSPAASSDDGIDQDAQLLTQSLSAYRAALDRLTSVPDSEAARRAIERVIAIGESGLSYPLFLARLEDEALTEALEGAVTPSRVQLESAVQAARQAVDPAREAEARAILSAYDELARRSTIDTVDPFAFELRRYEIAWQHAPLVARRDAMAHGVATLLNLVVDWIDAHTSWAGQDQRFQGVSSSDTARKIAMARECNPGFYAVRVRLFEDAFGAVPWWQRPELEEERRAGRIGWSTERIALAVEAIPHCVPLAAAPAELVARAESFGPNRF